MLLTRIPFSKDNPEDILLFAKANPWKPDWPEELMRRFLTKFVSSTDLVFDLHLDGERVAAAVLLDKVQNPGSFANLEILGLRPNVNPALVVDEVLAQVKGTTPSSQAGFQVSFHHSMPWAADLISKHGLTSYYETFEMLNENVAGQAQANKKLRLATSDDDEQLYQVLTDSFSANVDTSIPEFDDWKASRHNSKSSRTWLAEENHQIVGFLTMVQEPSQMKAEIRTVGVLHKMRGRGYGKALIQNALHHLQQSAINVRELTVAVQNTKALSLYEHLGFKRVDHYLVYRWTK